MTKSLPLRELLRQPAKVKKLTAAGHGVRITDRGVHLWDILPARRGASAGMTEQERADAIDAALDELTAAAPGAAPSLCRTILDARA